MVYTTILCLINQLCYMDFSFNIIGREDFSFYAIFPDIQIERWRVNRIQHFFLKNPLHTGNNLIFQKKCIPGILFFFSLDVGHTA